MWWPVFFGVGIGVYFGLRFEPPVFVGFIVFGCGLAGVCLEGFWVRVRKDDGLAAGQRVSVAGQLMPPSAPIMPGGFDFQCHMFFKRIGAVGFVYNAPEMLQEAPEDERFSLLLRRWRAVIVERVQVVLGERKGAIWRVSMFPLAGLLCLVFAFFGVALLKGWVRLVAVPLLIVGALVILTYKLPDILVAQSFPYEGTNDVMRCDGAACRIGLKGRKVSYVRDRLVIAAECQWADIVISDDFVRGAPCKVLSKGSGYKSGAHALYLDGQVQVETTEERRALRPWVAR